MAVGEIIGAAIGILMLIIVAYLVVGSTLSTAELVVNTQKDVTLQNEDILMTNIEISDAYTLIDTTNASADYYNVTFFNITNNGNIPVTDFNHCDVYYYYPGSPALYGFDETGDIGKWTFRTIYPDNIHPKMLDPGETMLGELRTRDPGPSLPGPSSIQFVTTNGVLAYGSTIINVV